MVITDCLCVEEKLRDTVFLVNLRWLTLQSTCKVAWADESRHIFDVIWYCRIVETYNWKSVQSALAIILQVDKRFIGQRLFIVCRWLISSSIFLLFFFLSLSICCRVPIENINSTMCVYIHTTHSHTYISSDGERVMCKHTHIVELKYSFGTSMCTTARWQRQQTAEMNLNWQNTHFRAHTITHFIRILVRHSRFSSAGCCLD